MKVMIVDDDKITRKLLSLYLKGKGYQIITAENGLEALEKLGTETVNLILADMNMPYMDGLELTKNIKKDINWRHIPVIMVTTESEEEDRKKAFTAGVDDYLVKPTTAEKISESISTIMKRMFKNA